MDNPVSFRRTLGNCGLQISALGLGTVKFGRNTGVKYPGDFSLPDDAQITALLAQAKELGINLLDTAPAYGNSEARLGQLLRSRQEWIITTKVGEEYDGVRSTFDFSAAHTRMSIERSLRRLRTDYLDLVLIHSDGNDEAILQDGACIEALRQCKQHGLVRAIGMSTKTISGGMRASELLDVVMVTYNLQQQDAAVVAQANSLGKGIIVKKGLMSGHVQDAQRDLVQESMNLILATAGIHSMIIGTLNPAHLAHNVACARRVTG